MQLAPNLQVDGYISIAASNASQLRGSHGAFRYFGKLAPDVTGRVLDLAAEQLGEVGRISVVDLMCGSGTTLIEASQRLWDSVGVDVNPVACLYARVKTRAVDADAYGSLLAASANDLDASCAEIEDVFGMTRNAARWFPADTMRVVASLSRNIDHLPSGRERDLLKAVLLSRLRRMSNASARTGRIFYDPSSAVDPLPDYMAAAKRILDTLPAVDLNTAVLEEDGRSTSLRGESAQIVFLHPPYFALYRYSSDVLRFEMEIGGYSRRETARREIREGWKSGDPTNLQGHLHDMGMAMAEGARLLSSGGILALTSSNSTLGDRQMPVIDGLAAQGERAGLQLVRHYERKAHHGAASYHRSARADKVIQQDHILLLRKP